MAYNPQTNVWVRVDPSNRKFFAFEDDEGEWKPAPWADIGICTLNAAAAVCSGICGARYEPWDLELAIAWLLGVEASELEAGKLEDYIERVRED